MIINIFKLILFSFLLNYVVSLQILNQSLTSKRERIVTIILSLFVGTLSGAIILWI